MGDGTGYKESAERALGINLPPSTKNQFRVERLNGVLGNRAELTGFDRVTSDLLYSWASFADMHEMTNGKELDYTTVHGKAWECAGWTIVSMGEGVGLKQLGPEDIREAVRRCIMPHDTYATFLRLKRRYDILKD